MLVRRALILVLLLVVVTQVRGAPSLRPGLPDLVAHPAAAVTWPVSTSLVVSEVVTGGVGASDEFLEIYNASAATADLAGIEVIYVTASGSTVSRKQTWTSLEIGAHRHLLIANSAGSWAAGADGLYTGGFAATGGSIALRVVGGAVIDSLSWGDAASSFVEGTAGTAPPAGSSLERRPGGTSGNATDTNDNAADTRVEPAPVGQPLAAGAVPPLATPSASVPPSASATPTSTLPPTPVPTQPCTPSPEPTTTASPTATPTPTPTPAPTTTPSPVPTPDQTATPTSDPSPTLSGTPTANPSQTSSATPSSEPTPSPSPTATPTSTPISTPTPSVTPSPDLSIAEVRTLPIGSRAVVKGVLVTPTDLIDGGQTAFVQDASAGIAVRLVTADWPTLPAGTTVAAEGLLESIDGLLVVTLELPG